MTPALHALSAQLLSGDVVLALALCLLGSAAAGVLAQSLLPRVGRRTRAYTSFAWQLGALLGLEQAYEFTRGRIPLETDIAVLNAYRLLDLEWQHGFFVESRIQHFFLQFQAVMTGIDAFYIFGHLLVTVGVLAWVYFCRREKYSLVRNLLMLTTAIALVVYYVFPTAPPRLLTNYGFVDPAVYIHHVAPAGEDQPGSYTYNPYAAMPSLHVAYALVIGIALFWAERRRWVKAIGILYPAAMISAVIISGNHWILDVLGALITVAVARLALLSVSTGFAHLAPFIGIRLSRADAQSAELPAA